MNQIEVHSKNSIAVHTEYKKLTVEVPCDRLCVNPDGEGLSLQVRLDRCESGDRIVITTRTEGIDTLKCSEFMLEELVPKIRELQDPAHDLGQMPR